MSTAYFPARTDKTEIEEGLVLQPKFDADGLIPCITTDVHTNDVLMFAFMNQEALHHTIETGKATYYSRSRQKLWIKGEESGNFQYVKELRVDCDQDVILLKVDIGDGAACHTGYRSCFFRKLKTGVTLELAEKEKRFDPKLVYKKK